MDNRLRNAVRLLGVLLLCGATAFVAGAVVPNRSVRLGNAAAETSPHDQTSLNIALTGMASASTAASGSPPSNAIDGSASTDWCATKWTGSLTVDLGRVRSLDGFGLTLGDAATTALVNLSYGTTAGSLRPVPDAQQQSVPAGQPVYWPSGHGLIRARFVTIDVTDGDGTPPCIGELRLFAPDSDRCDPGPGRRSVVRAAGGGGRSSLHRQRRARIGALDPQRPRFELRAAATLGQPAGGLQRSRERPADGAADQGRRRQAVPRHPLFGLLG